jgi:hypothetical protein
MYRRHAKLRQALAAWNLIVKPPSRAGAACRLHPALRRCVRIELKGGLYAGPEYTIMDFDG